MCRDVARHIARRSCRHLNTLVVVIAAGPILATAVAAQAPLLERGSVDASPTFESWTIGSGGLPETTIDGLSTVPVTGVSQWAIPVQAAVAIGSAWRLDASAAYASTHVTLGARDTSLNTTHYDLTGLSDVRIRATGRLVGDNVVLTLGVNAPSGATSLSPTQLSALRIVSAPALAFAAPVLGLGPSGTAGIVLAHEIFGWAWGIGGTYEFRGSYTPVSEVAGLGAPNFSPSDVIHFSAGTDGLIGQSDMSLMASVDIFGTSRLATPTTTFADTTVAGLNIGTRLGPIFTAAWQLRLPPGALRDPTLFITERYRSDYSREGTTVPRSSAHYVDAGASGVIPLDSQTGVQTSLYGRYQTGLASDSGFAVAGTRAVGLQVGLSRRIGQTLVLAPFVRAEIGQLYTGGATKPAHSLTGGVSLAEKF